MGGGGEIYNTVAVLVSVLRNNDTFSVMSDYFIDNWSIQKIYILISYL